MTHEELKELAINYYFDKNYFDTIEEYIAENNIKSLDIKRFKFLVKIENNRLDKTKYLKKVTPIFLNCTAFKAVHKKNNEKFIIFHYCTKNDGFKYQLSYFDKNGAYMDEVGKTLKEIINKYICNYNNYKIEEVIV